MYVSATSLWATHWLVDWHNWGLIAQVAIGLGMVVFVHELGHFLVAKACGVKCEKFYLGFDIFGLKLARFRWGETEYGIGILPLGGYVKMLGQEDNPTKAAEEFERAKLARDAADGDTLPEGEAAAETSIFDPRSYLAKSVPQRMAIISAGVVMNVLFAFAIAVLAYELGVKDAPCVVGGVAPGGPAWTAGLRPGDRVVRIGDRENPRFRDLQSRVVLGDNLENGVKFYVSRPGDSDTELFTLYPVKTGLAPRVGVVSASITSLATPPLSPNAPLGGKDCPLQPGDVVSAVGGVETPTNAAIQSQIARNIGPTSIVVLRNRPEGEPEKIAVDLPGRRQKGLGVVMEPGAIVAVQNDSPAAKAGLQKGDRILAIDGEPLGDPDTINNRLLPRAGHEAQLSIERDGKSQDLTISLREPYAARMFDVSLSESEPVAIATMGAAIAVTNRVASVVPDSPADRAGIKPGAEILEAVIPKRTSAEGVGPKEDIRVPFTSEKPNWPYFVMLLQELTSRGTPVEFKLGDDRTVPVEVVETEDWFADRGLNFEPLLVERRASSFGEAVNLGANEAVSSVAQVYSFLRALFRRQVSPKAMGGPVEIMRAAGGSAQQGISSLLIFLCMLSTNLAVLNFLPIPLLDGGHMVFLILEGIRGKPVSERVIVAFHYAGFLFIISLMAFVFLLDFHVIPRTP